MTDQGSNALDTCAFAAFDTAITKSGLARLTVLAYCAAVVLFLGVAELSQAIAANLTEAGEAITAFGATLDQARGELAERQAGWAEAVEQLEEAAEEQAERWTEGLSDLLNGQAEALLAATNQMIATHNETMEDLKQRFAVEAREKLVAALDPLRQELTRLGKLSASRQDQLRGRAGGITMPLAARFCTGAQDQVWPALLKTLGPSTSRRSHLPQRHSVGSTNCWR